MGRPSRPRQPSPPRARRRPWVVGGVLLAAVAVVWLVIHFTTTPLPPIPQPPTAGADSELVSAVDTARAKVVADPRSADAWGRYGMVLQAHEFDTDADTCYRAAASLAPADGRWPYLLARRLSATDPAAAVEWFDRALAADLPSPVARAAAEDARAEALLAAGRPAPVEGKPTSARRQLLAARAAAAAGDDARAADLLAGLTDHPTTARQALTLLAQVQQRLGRTELAAAAGRKAADRLPDAPWPDPVADPIAALNRTRVGRLDEASRLLREGRPAEAELLLRPLASGPTPDTRALLGLAECRAEQGDRPGAVAALETLVRLDPASADGHLQLAFHTFDDGERLWAAGNRPAAGAKFEAAVTSLDRVLAVRPDHPKATLLKGVAFERFLGRPADGLAILERFVRLRPELGEGHLRLGEALVAVGRPNEARPHLKQAASLARPGDTRAAEALSSLKGG